MTNSNLSLPNNGSMEILEGRKLKNTEILPIFYINRLCELNEEGEIIDTKKYDTVKFQNGLFQKRTTNDSRNKKILL